MQVLRAHHRSERAFPEQEVLILRTLSGLLAGLAIYIKSVGLFFLGPAFLVLVVSHSGFGRSGGSRAGLWRLLDSDQRALGYPGSGWNPLEWTRTEQINAAVTYGLTAIGLCLSWPALGWSCGVAINCWRRSGEALTRYQCTPSRLNAIEACVLTSSGFSLRAFWQTGHPQFHCGTPPPAAAPRTTIRSMIRPPAP